MDARAVFRDPTTWARFHGAMTIVWLILIPCSVIWLRESVPWIVLMSVWANFVGHFGSWQASRAERAVADSDIPSEHAGPP
jgi:hypothetical protein